LLLLRTDWMIYRWHLFWPDGTPWICKVSWRTEGSCFVPSRSVMMLCSKQTHLTVLSFILLCLTIAILLLGYHRHIQRIALLATASNWEHILHTTNSFSRKASIGTSLEDRPYHQGWRKAFVFHFPQNLHVLVRQIQRLPRSGMK
jgi:hypothetical protein